MPARLVIRRVANVRIVARHVYKISYRNMVQAVSVSTANKPDSWQRPPALLRPVIMALTRIKDSCPNCRDICLPHMASKVNSTAVVLFPAPKVKGSAMYVPAAARFKSQDPMPADGNPVVLGTPNLYKYAQNNPINRVDPSGLWSEEATIEAYERLYGDNEKAMLALFTVLTFYKLDQGDFWADDYAPPDPEKGVIQIARTAWFGRERTDQNAAEQLYEVFWRYFPEFELPRTWSRLAYDVPVGGTKAVVGGIGAVGLGAASLFDPDPTLITRIGLGGAAVVSADFAVEGATQITGHGGAGGISLIQEAAGWYGRAVGGEEGEESARRAIGVAQFALGLVGGLKASGSKVATTKLQIKNFRGTLADLKKAGIQDITSIRAGSRKLQDAFQRFRARFLDARGPRIQLNVRSNPISGGRVKITVEDVIQQPGQRPFTRGGIEGTFDPATGNLEIEYVEVDVDVRGQGIGAELYKRLIEVSGGRKVTSITGEMAFDNWTAIQKVGVSDAPRVKILNELGYNRHSFDIKTRIMTSRRSD